MKVVSRYIAKGNDAGPKAKVDIENILKKEYNANIKTYRMKSVNNSIFEKIKKTLYFLFTCSSKDILVCQHPLINLPWIYRAKYKICIIHDLGYFRTYKNELLQKEINTLNNFDVVIVHNKKMYEFLENKGLKSKMIILEFFDYLSEINIKLKNKKNISEEPIIIYPGNWDKDKATFLYELNDKKMKFKINIYGPNKNNNEISNKKIKYIGSYPPDEIIDKMDGDIGLVWSGKIDDSDKNIGDKKYNIYNTPHKLSCFLAAGLPVIVWKDSAIADVVKKYKIGYLIDNIYQINEIDFSNYAELKKNAENIGKRMRNGEFTKKAFLKAVENMKGKNK